jgi:methionyl-tRNA formyltransferase
VTEETEQINSILEYDLAISYGYKHLIPSSILKTLKAPPINLHISYLPFNRGYHPNFWAHYDGTPSGVSIHLIDQGIDTGEIIFRKQVKFNVNLLTFKQTWDQLNSEIEKMFIEKFNLIVSGKFTTLKQDGRGTFHSSSDLPENFKGWNSNISEEVKRLKLLNAMET